MSNRSNHLRRLSSAALLLVAASSFGAAFNWSPVVSAVQDKVSLSNVKPLTFADQAVGSEVQTLAFTQQPASPEPDVSPRWWPHPLASVYVIPWIPS